MTAYARVENGVVIETLDIGLDPNTIFPPEIPWTEIPEGIPVGQGWRYDGETFSEPIPPVPDIEQLTLVVKAMVDSRLFYAGMRIGPLQDAKDLDMATPEEEELLLAWKIYRIEVSRVPTQPGFPTNFSWPESPEGD